MKRHLSDSEPENCDDYDECSSPDTVMISRKKRRGIIEKRRRDRINTCLMELRRLVPQAFEKQGSAKLEKAEILQMTVEHLRHLHQTRDPRGFNDPYSAYGNTRAFLDYRIMGFREATAEVARYMTSVEGVDMKDPTHIRLLNHLENFLAQRELAINAAVAANAQINVSQQTPPVPTLVSVPATTPYAPLTPPRASPDNLSPPAATPETLPRFSVAFPATPMLTFASTSSVPMFRATPAIGIQPVIQNSGPTVSTTTMGVIKPSVLPVLPKATAVAPLNVLTSKPTVLTTNMTNPPSPTKPINKTPFRPWADAVTTADKS